MTVKKTLPDCLHSILSNQLQKCHMIPTFFGDKDDNSVFVDKQMELYLVVFKVFRFPEARFSWVHFW